MRVNHPRGISMGLNADAGLVPLADVGRNRLGVKMTRLATGMPRWPPRGNKTRSSASSQEAARRLAAHQLAVASWAASRNRLVSRRPGELRKAQPR
jgi:hypothetical protein